jgi:hypothetical protein
VEIAGLKAEKKGHEEHEGHEEQQQQKLLVASGPGTFVFHAPFVPSCLRGEWPVMLVPRLASFHSPKPIHHGDTEGTENCHGENNKSLRASV